MASILLRILILIVIVWLLKRVLMKILGTLRGTADGNQVASNYMVKDPVCGMYMDSRLAVRLDGRKEPLYFCSEDCRNKYLGRSGEDTGAGKTAR